MATVLTISAVVLIKNIYTVKEIQISENQITSLLFIYHRRVSL